MSKERELLERVMYMIPSSTISEHDLDLVDDIKGLLAQPEPFKPDWDNYKQGVADSKREPLSDEEIAALWANKSPANEFECVRLVEQAHGIGVER